MSDRIHAAIELTRVVSRFRWGFYFDLFCMVAIGMSLRPALAAFEPALTVAKGTFAFLASDRCPVRAFVTLLKGLLIAPSPTKVGISCGARHYS
jgi:hypothetical protein